MARLGELLEELRDNILNDKSDQVGARTDQKWTDKTLVRYINEAQDRFAKRSECLRDASTPEVCRLQLVVGQQDYALHPKIIGVISARVAGDGYDLARAGHSNLDTYRINDRRYYDTSAITRTPSKPIAFTTDEGLLSDAHNALNSPTFRVYPNVGAGYAGAVNLRVVRFPLTHLHLNDLNGQPEIPGQYHINMLDWAGYLALRQPDLDIAGGDAPGRAKELAASFENHVKDALRELKRRVFTPASFQFGGNGFTYERDWSG